MPFSLSMDLQQKPVQTLKQLQKLMMTRQMQQAIHLLQVPIQEIAPLVEVELQQNPVLEQLEEDEVAESDADLQQLEEEVEEEPQANQPVELSLKFNEKDIEVIRRLDEEIYASISEGTDNKPTSEEAKLQNFLENSIPSFTSLFEYLMEQAHEVFSKKEELELAELLIGNLDENGFLATPLSEIALLQKCSVEELEKILKVIQTFHPYGVGAVNLKESLLIQLERKEAKGTVSYRIVQDHFEDLLYNRIPKIQKSLHCSAQEIEEAIHEIAKLDFHPATQLSTRPIPYIVPDISLKEEEGKLIVSVNEEYIPRLRLNHQYLKMLDDESLNSETKDFILKKIASAKWLMRNLMQRSSTLEKIAQSLAKSQKDFLMSPSGKLIPLTMKMIADELELHESTIARAVANKYIDTPKGVLALKFFFTSGLIDKQGDNISSHTVRDILFDIIQSEDKRHPLSDEAISNLIKQRGIKCARRTVAKYRALLKIGNTQQRRKFS